jgi:hypothetical protein
VSVSETLLIKICATMNKSLSLAIVSLTWLLHVGLSYEIVPLDEMYLNRIGNVMSSDQLDEVPYAQLGFTWEDGDASTLKWRPQGVATVPSNSTEYIAVSWYGRSQEGYEDRGVRISFVNTQNTTVTYRHVLLVDENFNTFPNMHAGGLACTGDELLHVPDSRSGTKKIYTFSTSEILYIPSEDRGQFYDYAYVMQRVGSYDVPITPSFLSYDWTRSKMLVGTFYQCSDYHKDTEDCLNDTHTQLSWYTVGDVDSHSPSCQPFFSEMQGAASSKENSSFVLWSSSSYGSGHESHLHISTLPTDQCDASSPGGTQQYMYRTVVYPPGLEDLSSSAPGSMYAEYLWMLTEFGSKDGSGNTRRVFAVKVESLLP